MTRSAATDRDQTRAEEIANSLSHGIGFVLAIASLPLLLAFAGGRTSAINIVAMSVFSATMMLLYGVSTLYQAVRHVHVHGVPKAANPGDWGARDVSREVSIAS